MKSRTQRQWKKAIESEIDRILNGGLNEKVSTVGSSGLPLERVVLRDGSRSDRQRQ